MYKYFIPSIFISLVYGFYPWGLITLVIALIWLGFLGVFFPSRKFFNSNLKLATEALSFGNYQLAIDHIGIALREIERSENKFDSKDVDKILAITHIALVNMNDPAISNEASVLLKSLDNLKSKYSA